MPLNTSQFPASTNPPNTTDLLPIMQGGRMKQTTLGALFTQLAAFLQSGIAAPLTSWTVATKLQEIEVSAGDSAAASVTAKIDAAITGAAGRIVWIPPTMGAGEATTYPVGTCVIDLRAGTPGSGAKIVPNFVDSAGHIRWLVIDDQTSPTLSANAAALFNHRPTGTLPNSSTGEGAHCVGQTTGALLNSPTGYTLSGVEGGVSIGSTGGTIPDAWGVTANSATAVSSTTNVTRLVSVYAQAPSKSGSGTITNAYTIIAEDPGSIASSDNLSLWAKGAVRIGPQGTGAVNATLVLDGSSASGQGAVLTLQRNGTPAAQVCTEGAIIGGGSANLYLNKVTSGNVKVGINSVDVAIFGTTGVQILSTVAIPAGGTAGTGYTFSSTSNFGVFFGSGAPALSAAKGSLYLRSNGTTTNDRAFINTDGGTTWTALTTAA